MTDLDVNSHAHNIETIAVLGAGRVGTAIARQALAAGYRVIIAASGPVSEIELLVDIVVPGAIAGTAAEAVAGADLIILAVPMHKYRTLDAGTLAGRIVVDAMNHWAPVDGFIAEFDAAPGGTSEHVQSFMPDARLVKTLNHIGYHELESDGRPPGASDRRALVVAGNDSSARRVVAGFIDRLGFDPVDAGLLVEGMHFEPGTDIFNGAFGRQGLERALEASRAGEFETRLAS